MPKLLIVESPAKASTIKKYLGKDYEIVASMGHVRDLPPSKMGVDIDHDFAPQYVVIKGRQKLIDDRHRPGPRRRGDLMASRQSFGARPEREKPRHF